MQKLKRYTRAIVQNAAANLFAVFTKIADLYSLLEDVYKGDILYYLVKVLNNSTNRQERRESMHGHTNNGQQIDALWYLIRFSNVRMLKLN